MFEDMVAAFAELHKDVIISHHVEERGTWRKNSEGVREYFLSDYLVSFVSLKGNTQSRQIMSDEVVFAQSEVLEPMLSALRNLDNQETA